MKCRTKIIATIGPASKSTRTIEKLIHAGMDVARLNFGHGSKEEHEKILNNIRAASKKTGRKIGILVDLQGPKIRIGSFTSRYIRLREGDIFTITTRDIRGTEKIVSTNYKDLPKDVTPGTHILLDDGHLELIVEKVHNKDIECRVVRGGKLYEKKGINIPDSSMTLESLTDKDKKDIDLSIDEGVDFLAISFVRTARDVIAVKKYLQGKGAHIPVIAKIEKPEAVKNIDKILAVTDGIMVARGDLGVELSPEKVPIIQKEIIRKCNEEAIPVITATQMLESMIHSPRPTRAEASDVANAILDGTDALMLSGETAMGKFPVEAVSMMTRIANETEENLFEYIRPDPEKIKVKGDVEHAVAHAVCYIARDIDAKAIVTFTRSGRTACIISKYRPSLPIIGVTHSKSMLGRLSLYWGVQGAMVELKENTDTMIKEMEERLLQERLVSSGDKVIITLGVPWGVVGSTNMLMVHHIK